MSKNNKILLGVLIPTITIVLSFLILCFVTMGMYSPIFLRRVLTHWDSSVSDSGYFPKREVAASDSPYTYVKEINHDIANINVEYSNGKKLKQKSLTKFIDDTDTTSFIIVKNDKIVFEKYSNGYTESTVNTSFSMAKSVVSLLIGKALEDGYIKSINEPVSKYIDEFKDIETGKTTIEDLLLMRSRIEYDESKFLWFGDDSLTYWYDDLRALALNHTALRSENNFLYNNYHPLLLGIILERCTGRTVSEYFEEKIWKPIGAEFTASWSLDSEKSGFEKMESGINFRATDFLKIGSLVLHKGEFNGNKIISEDWLSLSTLGKYDASEYNGTFLENRGIGYKYMWYYYPSEIGYDVLAWGKSDQILFISPENNTVILRTGKNDGNVKDWEKILKYVSSV